MDFYAALHEAGKSSGKSMREISLSIHRNPNFISNSRSHGSSPSVDLAAIAFGACGWQLVAVPQTSMPPDAILIEPSEASLEKQRRAAAERKEKLRAQLEEMEEDELGA